MQQRKSAIVRFILTLGISAAGLYFALRRIEWQALGAELRTVDGRYLVPAVLASFSAMVLRSVRWHLVLSREKKFSFSNTFWANAMGYLGNNVLPARAGELIRSVALALSAGIRKSLVLATALTERMLDAGILLLLALSMVQFTGALPETVTRLWSVVLPVVVGLIVFALAAPLFEAFWLRLLNVLPLPDVLRGKLRHLLEGLLAGLRVFHHARLLFLFLVLSCAIWAIDAGVFIALAFALGKTLNLPQAIVFTAALGFASSIPSTPGYVGVYQAVAVLVLPVFMISANKAFLIVTFFQVMFLAITVVFGGYGWFVMQRRIGEARFKAELEAENQA